MPYIKQEKRKEIINEDLVRLQACDCAGDIQYVIALMIKSYVRRKHLNYQTCNDIMGALVGAQQEFYRRVVAPYEKEKIEENGDI